MVSIPDGDSFLREGRDNETRTGCVTVSIPDGDSFLREASEMPIFNRMSMFQSPMGIVSSAKCVSD